MKMLLCVIEMMFFPLLLAACDQKPQQHPLQYSNVSNVNHAPRYRLTPHPLYNPQKLSETFQPLINHINRQIPDLHIELEASRDYQSFENKFRAREAEILMPNPWQTLEAMKVGYHVIAMWGDAEDFKGIFVIRIDSGIRTPHDLKGKIISYPSPTALAAAVMPQFFLYTNGININTDIQNMYVGSQESSIMNVFMGYSDAGATWPPPWRRFQKEHPAEAKQLKVIWETPPLLNNSVMVRDDVPETVRQKIRQTLLDLSTTSEGKKILGGMETAHFHAADNTTYDIVRQYVAHFETVVRPVERK